MIAIIDEWVHEFTKDLRYTKYNTKIHVSNDELTIDLSSLYFACSQYKVLLQSKWENHVENICIAIVMHTQQFVSFTYDLQLKIKNLGSIWELRAADDINHIACNNRLEYLTISPLFRTDELEEIKNLLAQGENINAIDTQSHRGFTKLFAAVKDGNYDLAKFLIENGADIELYSQANKLVLHFADYSFNIHSDQGLLDWSNMINLLLDNGFKDLSTFKDAELFAQACRFGDYDIARKMLERGFNANIKTEFYTGNLYGSTITPLEIACKHYRFAIIKLLFSYGVEA